MMMVPQEKNSAGGWTLAMRTINRLVAVGFACALAAGAVAHGNLLTNGGFETGDFTGWTTFRALGGSGNGPGVRTSGYSGQPPQAGNYLVEIYENSGSMNGDGGGIEQSVSVMQGRLYALSYYLNSVNSDTKVTVSVLDALDNSIVELEHDATQGSWDLHETEFIAATADLTVRLKETSDNSSSRDPLLDSIGMVLVPEPGVASLLVLGGLVLAAHRRR